MGGFSTRYGGDTVNLQAGSDLAGGGGGVDPFFRDLLERQMRAKERRDEADLRATRAAAAPPPPVRQERPREDPQTRELKRLQIEAARRQGARPKDFGRYMMNARGQWGTFVDPTLIPADLQDKIMGGFAGEVTNWDSSNPSIMGPQQWRTGKYQHSGGTSMPSQIVPEEEDPEAHGGGVEFEKERFRSARQRSDIEAAQRMALSQLPTPRG